MPRKTLPPVPKQILEFDPTVPLQTVSEFFWQAVESNQITGARERWVAFCLKRFPGVAVEQLEKITALSTAALREALKYLHQARVAHELTDGTWALLPATKAPSSASDETLSA